MNRTVRSIVSLCAASAVASASTVALAAEGTMSFEGRTKGSGERFANVTYSVISPRDAASGQATGKRQHKPVCMTRTPLASSTTFFNALVTNELIKTVTFETSLGMRIKLSNAAVISYKLFEERDQEEICFSFVSIELAMRGGSTVTDSWGGSPR